MSDAPKTASRESVDPVAASSSRPDGRAHAAADDFDVPKLPRGRGIRLSGMQLIRVIGLAAMLGFLIVTQRPCANAISTFVTSFDDRGSASGAAPGSPSGATAGSAKGSSDLDRYEQLRPGMTEEETKAAIERARAKAH